MEDERTKVCAMDDRETDKRIDDLSDRVGRFEAQVDRRFERFEDKVDERFDKVDARFDKVEERIDRVVTTLGTKIDRMNQTLIGGLVAVVVAIILKAFIG